jgi:hypothetical protein
LACSLICSSHGAKKSFNQPSAGEWIPHAMSSFASLSTSPARGKGGKIDYCINGNNFSIFFAEKAITVYRIESN